ncbi:MAG: VOC family protein [Deltaproteobacteria bacterium]|nr:VOC family protein [Deltaproteobacteria bacterium]MBW2284389.1 VOC family protein [Deltaproteobacteria bacterium]
MVLKIEHIGIIVKDLEASMKKYTSHLGLKVEEVEEIEVDGVLNRVAFLPVKDTNIELVQTTAETGLAAEFLKERGEGLHHIALEVDDIDKTFEELRSQGVEFVWDRIIDGSRGSRVAFFKAEEFNGVYIELVQKH